MKKYDVKQIMISAHRFYSSRSRMGLSWSEVVKMAWQWAYDAERHREEREARVREMLKGYKPKPLPDYNDKSIPQSAYYNPNSKGHMGAHYVGD